MRTHKTTTFVAIVLAMILGLAAPAAAHDPVFLTADQSTPETGPYFPDGTISWAVYGSVLGDGDTRGFEFDLRDGDELFISLLIPNLAPELDLAVDELPTMDVIFPDGTTQTIEPVLGEVFDEVFSGTSYVTLHEDRTPAQAGRHQVIVNGRAAARFSVAVGETEEFGTPAERTVDRPAGFANFAEPLNEWWTTPPGAEAPVESGEAVTIDIEGAEEALEEIAANEAAEEAEAAQAAEATIEAGEAEDVEAEDIETEVAGAVEVAAAPVDADGGGSPTWVIPVVIVLLGAAFVGGRMITGRS